MKICYIVIIIFIIISIDVYGESGRINANERKWRLVEAPTKGQLNYIKIVNSNEGYIAGRNILKYDGKKWSLMNPQPPSSISHLFVLNGNNIWSYRELFTSESELFFYNGKSWKKEYSPLANQIEVFHLNAQHKGWVGNWGEIAYCNGNSWKLIPYPKTEGAVVNLYGDDNNVWAQCNSSIYFYNGQKWIRYLEKQNIISSFFVSIDNCFIQTDSKIYQIKNHQLIYHSESELLKSVKKIFVIDEKNMWGIGAFGCLIQYINGEWEKVNLPVQENLNDIQMISKEEGWIVGDKGTILYYGNSRHNSAIKNQFGFDRKVVYSFGREVNDEYGVAIEDFDGDGYKDIYSVCIFDPNRLYMNISSKSAKEKRINELSFHEEASKRGLTGVFKNPEEQSNPDLFLGVGSADFDNDGDQDIYLCNLIGKNKILLNNGNGYFRNVSEQSKRATDKEERTNSAVFGDIDNDGDLDLFITNEFTTNRLYLNDGNGYFTEITDKAGVRLNAAGMCSTFGDIDNDGDLDLYVTNWFSKNVLYRNDYSKSTGVKFTNITDEAGVGGEPYCKSNGAAFADFDNDGDLDLFVANRKTSNCLYVNDGLGKFQDRTKEIIGIDSMLSYGCSFADFDQDGFPDLYVSNVGENILYRNIEGKKFIDATFEFDAQLGGYSTGTATADIDNDGDLELYVANYINANSTLFINNVNNKNYIKVILKGTKSNADAIGAKVWLYPAGKINNNNFLLGFQEVNGGSGYASHNSTELHFGVRDKNNLNDIVVYFPASGILKVKQNIKAGTILYISEEDGVHATISNLTKTVSRFLHDPEIHLEGIEILFIITCVTISIHFGRKRYKWNPVFQVIYITSLSISYLFQNIIFLHQRLFLSTILPVSSVIVAIIIIHLIFERISMKKNSFKEKQETRDRIARDLHDDLASTLSSVLIYSETLKRSVKETELSFVLFTKINTLLMQASDSITDIVWSVSPQHDQLEDLLVRLRILLSDICGANQIKYKIDISKIDSEFSVEDNLRRNIFLIFKEAINNSIKYSHADMISFTASMDNKVLQIILSDNGKGINKEEEIVIDSAETNSADLNSHPLRGKGIKNMLSRAKESNARLIINSSPGTGTKVYFSRKMT